MSSNSMKVTFCAGAGTVTGANFLVEIDGKKLLIDCGLVQTSKMADDINWNDFPYSTKEIDAVFISHAHVDHIGRIPKLVNDGYKGPIFSTPPTKALAVPMLLDMAAILSHDRIHDLHTVYADENLRKAHAQWKGLDYHEVYQLTPNVSIMYRDAGHILGSGMIEFTAFGKKIVFTGDLGNSPSPLLRDTESISGATYLIMESVYGDRVHESRNERKKLFEAVIEDNYKRKGVLMIPSFSLERTQELLIEMNDLVENKRIPEMPVYLDSPLAIELTKVYKQFPDYFNDQARALVGRGDDIFSFPGLHITSDTDDSKHILHSPNPKIIIAGSGMSSGGRIVHHEKNYLPGQENTLLLIGYQSVGTLGRAIEDGARDVTIMGEKTPVRAHITKISGYSGHKDTDALMAFVQGVGDSLKRVYAVMGEPKSSLFFAQRVRDNLGISAYAPEANETIELPL